LGILENLPLVRGLNDLPDPQLSRVGQSLKEIGHHEAYRDIKTLYYPPSETMMDGEKVIQELSKFMIGWEFSYIDAIGRSGGNITGWKRSSYTLSNSWAFPTGLGVALFSMDMGK
jgi:hypothetical protein